MENCYFYTTRRDGETFVATLCVSCHDTEYPDLGWFWEGAHRGYGPFLFKCEKCSKVIHNGDAIVSVMGEDDERDDN